jgi:hypothetical protein
MTLGEDLIGVFERLDSSDGGHYPPVPPPPGRITPLQIGRLPLRERDAPVPGRKVAHGRLTARHAIHYQRFTLALEPTIHNN